MIKELNGLRGIAVLLVFTAHTPIRLIIGDFGQQAVYIFFVLSSFLLTVSLLNNNEGLKFYITKRFFRIYPLYFLIISFLFIVSNIDFSVYIINIFFLQEVFNVQYILSVSWSLIIEVQMYITLPLVLYILNKNGKLNYKLCLSIFILVYLFRIFNLQHYLENANEGSMRIVDGYMYEVFDFFLLGIILAYKYKKKAMENFSKKLILFALILFLIIPFILEKFEINRTYEIFFIIIPTYTVLIYILFTAALTKKSKLINWILNLKIFSFYALISSFYLIHLPILKYFKKNVPDYPLILVGIISFIFITLFSYTLYRYYEIQFLKISRYIYEK